MRRPEGMAKARCYDTRHATLEAANGDGRKAVSGEEIENPVNVKGNPFPSLAKQQFSVGMEARFSF